MERVKLLPRHRHAAEETAYLVDDTHAVMSDGTFVRLVEVEHVEPGIYRPAYDFAFITIAKGGRTVSALERIVKKLQSMSAYELLTQHYNKVYEHFYVNKRVENCGRTRGEVEV